MTRRAAHLTRRAKQAALIFTRRRPRRPLGRGSDRRRSHGPEARTLDMHSPGNTPTGPLRMPKGSVSERLIALQEALDAHRRGALRGGLSRCCQGDSRVTAHHRGALANSVHRERGLPPELGRFPGRGSRSDQGYRSRLVQALQAPLQKLRSNPYQQGAHGSPGDQATRNASPGPSDTHQQSRQRHHRRGGHDW